MMPFVVPCAVVCPCAHPTNKLPIKIIRVANTASVFFFMLCPPLSDTAGLKHMPTAFCRLNHSECRVFPDEHAGIASMLVARESQQGETRRLHV